MNDLDVRIVALEPMRMASSYAFGHNPEEQAWQKLFGWAQPKGFLDERTTHPIFGFNNPNPSQGNPKYGYEFWIKVEPSIEPEGEIRIIEFTGGTYAVTTCDAGADPGTSIPAAWMSLAAWCKANNRRFGRHQALEKILSDPSDPARLVLELFCPVID